MPPCARSRCANPHARWGTRRRPAAEDPYDTHTETRGAGIYLARQAKANLALGDMDAAVEAAQQAIEQLGGADSTRGTSTLADLRGQLTAHRRDRPVTDFLALAA